MVNRLMPAFFVLRQAQYKCLKMRRGNELDLDFNTGGNLGSLISSTLVQRAGRSDSASRCFFLKKNGVYNPLKISGGNKLDLDLYEGRNQAGCYAGGARRKIS